MSDKGLKIEVDTSFARALLEVLKRLPTDIRRNLSGELRDAAKAIAQRARFIVRDEGQAPRSRTGETARLTRHRRGRGGLSYLVETKASPTKGPVGLWLEGGTEHGGRRITRRERSLVTGRGGVAQLRLRRRSVRIGGQRRTPAYPYITRALEERRAITERSLSNAVAEAIEEAAKRAGA